MARIKVVVSPLYYERVIKLMKKARSQAKIAMRQWMESEESRGPLFTELTRLRALVASHERSLRIVSQERDALRTRLDMIDAAIAKTVEEAD